ncbi:hypothetical protein [Thermodesulfatator autotrophicus]|uniref:Quinohemoprotein amine dehydrogenase alpha subunit haem binding domain-containing protein n=1 Tax=Thermodesulfatator autotrophicus TaxID=1795632 RepID=A0A177E8W4_9BACT|nr:hypothetical protein [Thermodesulfatator autotrophicus]OAG27850.1 hypothetical protein TH606_04780 [Thermodesulfatator autotrophicus]
MKILSSVLAFSLFIAVAACSANSDFEKKATSIINAKCVECHSTDRTYAKKGMSPEWWKETIKRMRSYGAPLTDQEAKTILEYLSK